MTFSICEVIDKDIIYGPVSDYIFKLRREDKTVFPKSVTRVEWLVTNIRDKIRHYEND